MRLLTILIPAFEEAENIPLLDQRLHQVVTKLSLDMNINSEVILLDNGSNDSTRDATMKVMDQRKYWKYIRYSRNFGYHNSIAGGFKAAKGDGLIVLAADLQEPPELINTFVSKWLDGYDVIYGTLRKRNDDNILKTIGAFFFYRILFASSNSKIPINATDFRLIDRKVIDAINNMPEQHRYLRGLVHWSGFKQTGIKYDREERKLGESTAGLIYSLSWGVNAIVCFSNFPLRILFFIGMIILLATIVGTALFLSLYLFDVQGIEKPPKGLTTLALLSFFGIGLNATFLGIIGEYVGRIYEQSKNRPLYIIEEEKNFD